MANVANRGIIRFELGTAICGHCGGVLRHPGAPCLHCGAAPSGGAQAAAFRRAPKRPAVAAALAVIPGLGHFYLGHNLKGLMYLLGTGGLELFGLDLDLTAIGIVAGVPMELGGFGLWVHGIMDAYRTAKREQGAA